MILMEMNCFLINDGFVHTGILSQKEWNDSLRKHGDAYIAASYVKYIESAGARVVPVLVNQTDLYYDMIFNSVNG